MDWPTHSPARSASPPQISAGRRRWSRTPAPEGRWKRRGCTEAPTRRRDTAAPPTTPRAPERDPCNADVDAAPLSGRSVPICARPTPRPRPRSLTQHPLPDSEERTLDPQSPPRPSSGSLPRPVSYPLHSFPTHPRNRTNPGPTLPLDYFLPLFPSMTRDLSPSPVFCPPHRVRVRIEH